MSREQVSNVSYFDGNDPLSGGMCCETPIETIGESEGSSAARLPQCSGKSLGRPIGYCRLEDDM